jgi:hypothetical protein
MAWLALPAILFLTTGCGGGTDKKPKQSTSVAQTEQGQDEEKDAAPPPPVKKKAKAVEKPAEPAPLAASKADVKKWNLDDLNAALLRKDVQFVFGVMFYGMSKPNDAKRAEELDALVKKVARLKDDPVAEVPIPPGAFVDVDTDEPLDAAAKTGTTAAAPAATGPRPTGMPFRGGLRRGRGDGGK